jgi:hypothetical protein
VNLPDQFEKTPINSMPVFQLTMSVTFPGLAALIGRIMPNTMRLFLLLLFLIPLLLSASSSPPMPGLPTGKAAPAIHARDQFGKEQTIASLMGPKGLVLLFFRSSDW